MPSSGATSFALYLFLMLSSIARSCFPDMQETLPLTLSVVFLRSRSWLALTRTGQRTTLTVRSMNIRIPSVARELESIHKLYLGT